jgi:hypothetical protein
MIALQLHMQLCAAMTDTNPLCHVLLHNISACIIMFATTPCSVVLCIAGATLDSLATAYADDIYEKDDLDGLYDDADPLLLEAPSADADDDEEEAGGSGGAGDAGTKQPAKRGRGRPKSQAPADNEPADA